MTDAHRPRDPISRERWVHLSPLIDAALDLTPEERDGYCERIAADDPALGAELRRLVGQLDGGDGLLSAAALERFSILFDDEPAPPAVSDLLQRLQTSLGTAYRLEREMVGGGMSRVFIADEPGLGRQVVIKVLKRERWAGIDADRFAREIRLAASLQQANIVPLLSAGTAAGFPYYTMPLVEGRSLRERLARDGALPIGEAVSILRDVARALAFAHGRGVVHRDIKPGNVLLSGGTAVVTDFGIAKAIGASRSTQATADDAITEAGTSLGTPSYMAPEQATGDPATNHRADLYAFGCLAYEIFTGAPPFHGATVYKIIDAHLKETPRLVTEKRADVPAPVAALIARCLEKDPEHRPQTATEVLAVLDGETTMRVAGTVPRRWRTVVAVGTVGVAAIASTLIFARRAPSDAITLAAIPFTLLQRDTALEYRTVGLSDEIMTGMAKVPGVHIIGRLAAYRYKDSIPVPDVRSVARALGVRFLVTGTYGVHDGRVTISAQLNDSTTRSELWADRFSRDAEAIGPITDDIVRTIADTLRAHFSSRVGAVRRGTSTVGTTNNAAHEQYLIGQNLVKQRGSGVRRSVENFEQAIKLDSNYAQAYAALATALQFYPFYVGIPHDSVKARMMAAANRAIALDSTLADPHAALGAVYAATGQWQAFEDEFRRALKLEPDNVPVLHAYARLLLVFRGNVREAIEQLRHARRLERGSALISSWLAYAFFVDGHVDSAMAEYSQAARLDSTIGPVINLGSLLNLSQGRDSVARRLMRVAPPPYVMSNAPYVYARLGDTVKANVLIRAMESSNPRPWFTDVAQATVQLAMGDSAGALGSLERSARAYGPVWVMYLPIADPAFDLVRASPRFIQLLERARLDPRAFDRVRPRD